MSPELCAVYGALTYQSIEPRSAIVYSRSSGCKAASRSHAPVAVWSAVPTHGRPLTRAGLNRKFVALTFTAFPELSTIISRTFPALSRTVKTFSRPIPDQSPDALSFRCNCQPLQFLSRLIDFQEPDNV